MKITFDPTKDNANKEKHGVSLALATDLEWNWMMATQDTRHPYGEIRMVGYAPLGKRVFCVVFTDRGEERRIISLRKANDREVSSYASQI
ncbi:MAG: BrnT family toxin [Magnetococcales bacterium]|nr:BrnT family toxin [Magnetococcales bacterium]